MRGRTKLPNPRKRGEPITLDWIRSNCDVSVRVIPMSECWTWLGSTNKHGYGLVWDAENWKVQLTHRLAAEMCGVSFGSLFADHVCRNRACVNTNHIEVVSNLENVMRGDQKKHRGVCARCGSDDLYNVPGPNRVNTSRCRRCHAARERARKAAKRSEAFCGQ